MIPIKKNPKRETRYYVCSWEDPLRFVRYTAIADVECAVEISEEASIAEAIEVAVNSRQQPKGNNKTMHVIRLEAMPEYEYTTEFKVTRKGAPE